MIALLQMTATRLRPRCLVRKMITKITCKSSKQRRTTAAIAARAPTSLPSFVSQGCSGFQSHNGELARQSSRRMERLALVWLLSWHLSIFDTFSDQFWRKKTRVFKIPGQLRRAPMAVNAGGARGSTHQFKATVALKHDLAVVTYLADVRSVFIETHGAHQ